MVEACNGNGNCNGKVIISDSSLCKLLPPNVKPMSKQRRNLCGCEICVSADILQHSINAWRTKNLKRLEDIINARRSSCSSGKIIERYNKYKNNAFPQGFPLHRKASQAAFSTMCSFTVENIDILHWHCVLKCCENCSMLVTPNEEVSISIQVPPIKFHVYKNVYRCSVCGQLPFDVGEICMTCRNKNEQSMIEHVYKRKELVLLTESVSNFHQNYCKPAIEKLAYHSAHVKILGTTHIGLTRRETLSMRHEKKDIKVQHDFADRLVAAFLTEIQSEHFGGNQTLSMEGLAMEYIDASNSLNELNSFKG